MTVARKLNPIVGGVIEFDEVILTDKVFHQLSEYIYELAGVDLPNTAKNHALVRNRIVKIMRKHSLDSFEGYWEYLKAGGPEQVSEFISAMTTNMTSFYREPSHFEFLAEILPELYSRYSPDIRIWCAAASTGQEPYTIAMTVCEKMADECKKTRILATDIDLQVLKKGASGTYDDRETQGLPLANRNKYFDKVKPKENGKRALSEGNFWRAKDQLHNLIRFAPFNLMSPRYEFKNKFHVIFCRNVLIYFDEETTQRVINNLVECLDVGCYLILGHSESGNIKHPKLKPLSRAVYQKI